MELDNATSTNLTNDEFIINKTKLQLLSYQGEYIEDLSGLEIKMEDLKLKSEVTTFQKLENLKRKVNHQFSVNNIY